MSTLTSPKTQKENINFPFNYFPLDEAIERINTHSPNLIDHKVKINGRTYLIKNLYLSPVILKRRQVYDIIIDIQPKLNSPLYLDSLLMHLKVSGQ